MANSHFGSGRAMVVPMGTGVAAVGQIPFDEMGQGE